MSENGLKVLGGEGGWYHEGIFTCLCQVWWTGSSPVTALDSGGQNSKDD